MKIEPDDFAIWQASPITQALHKALRRIAAEAKQAWIAKTWEGGVCDERVLIDLRATETVALDICDLTLEELEEKLGKG